MKTLETILLYSFRYALGRKTMAVYDVGEALLSNKNTLSKNTKRIICQEIAEAAWNGEAGGEMEIALWSEVYAELLDE